MNSAGPSVGAKADIERIHAGVEEKLAPLGHKVYCIVNYDRFTIEPELIDDYIAMVKGLTDRHYIEVTRYTSSTFLRLHAGRGVRQRQSPAAFVRECG